MTAPGDTRPLVLHVVYRFDVGGLENGVVNLINHLPAARWRHAVLAMTEVEPTFSARLQRDDVRCIALHKPPGQGVWIYPRLLRVLRELQPAIMHTRNLAALEAQAPAAWAGVRARVHGEHGRDVEDLHGTSRRHQWMRRAYRPFVHQYVALSRELGCYLQQRVGVPAARITQIYNGVDTERFHPAADGRAPIEGSPFNDRALWLVGTVGRMQTVKNQPLLVRAFVQALQQQPALRARMRLVLVGSGPLRAECEALLQAAGLQTLAWLPGERSDMPDVMRGLDCFVLPSLAEGISNTILEAMATALPVLATQVGGNADLVAAGMTGDTVPSADVKGLADCLVRWAGEPQQAAALGRAGRQEVERRFSLPAMVAAYAGVYERLLRPVAAQE
jgi:sugar transferase (PEP-CTERM/EpsH1 system associated)